MTKNTKRFTILRGVLVGLCSLCITVSFAETGQKSRVDEMRSKLKGGAKTRGYKRPDSETSKERSFYAEVGKIGPKALSNLTDSDEMKVTFVTAPDSNPLTSSKGDLGLVKGAEAIRVDYSIDPSSQLTGEVFFAQGSSKITDASSQSYLRDLAKALNDDEMRKMSFVIEGHASAEGDAVANKRLSVQRAKSIYDTLVGQYGVVPYQIVALGFGEDEARYAAQSANSVLAMDRRVLIYRLVSSGKTEPEPEEINTSRPKKAERSGGTGVTL